MKKLKIAFLVLIILIVLCIFISKSVNEYTESLDISNEIGREYTGGELSYKEFIILAQNTVGVYYNYLKNNEYEKAYSLFTPEYRSYESSGEYIERISKESIQNFAVNDIVQKSEYMYEAFLTLNDASNETMMIFIKDKEFALAPGEFIKYKELNLKEENSKIEVELLNSKVELFNCSIKMNINNYRKEECEISKISVETTQGKKIYASNTVITINPEETVEIDAKFNTEIDFPKIVEIEVNISGKIKTIKFEI